ncbi:MAG TPA: hypothetical protein PLU52_11600 [Opitutaceae bacterium]|nr:hypothetical protein [Opitutaceae bacterium]
MKLIRFVWRSMINRCHRPEVENYPNYGGRGIAVCDRWRSSFDAFMADMGERPPGGTIERRDNDGPYGPENCLWVTRADQSRNKRNNRLITANGRTMTMADWARELGINPAAILYRIRAGWTAARAVTEPAPERPNSKLSPDQVRAIRAAYPGKTYAAIAQEHGVSKKTVMNVVQRRIFRDL